jgi:SAM-dependent methyltransferase
MEPRVEALLAAATRPYRDLGRHAWHFARGKLSGDPVFLSVLRGGWLPARGTLLDLGCGRGLLLSLILAARERHAGGEWPAGFPPPPAHLELHGIEYDERAFRVARSALEGRARVARGDIRDGGFPVCSAVVMLDVLMYLSDREQIAALRLATAALQAGGLMLVREADAASGLAFQVTRWSELVLQFLRGRLGARQHYRSRAEWTRIFESLGFSVTAEPMSQGTPFANVLYVCKKG